MTVKNDTMWEYLMTSKPAFGCEFKCLLKLSGNQALDRHARNCKILVLKWTRLGFESLSHENINRELTSISQSFSWSVGSSARPPTTKWRKPLILHPRSCEYGLVQSQILIGADSAWSLYRRALPFSIVSMWDQSAVTLQWYNPIQRERTLCLSRQRREEKNNNNVKNWFLSSHD